MGMDHFQELEEYARIILKRILSVVQKMWTAFICQNRDLWQALENMEVNLWALERTKNFFRISFIVCLSRRTLLHEIR
jgi:hypothetical protein